MAGADISLPCWWAYLQTIWLRVHHQKTHNYRIWDLHFHLKLQKFVQSDLPPNILNLRNSMTWFRARTWSELQPLEAITQCCVSWLDLGVVRERMEYPTLSRESAATIQKSSPATATQVLKIFRVSYNESTKLADFCITRHYSHMAKTAVPLVVPLACDQNFN